MNFATEWQEWQRVLASPRIVSKSKRLFNKTFFCLQTMLIQACHCPRQVIWSDLNCLHSILFLTALTPNDQQVLMKKIRTLDLSVQELTLLAPIDHHYSSIHPCIELGQRLSHRTVPYERNRGTPKKEVFVRFKNKNGREKKKFVGSDFKKLKKNNWNGIASIFVSRSKNFFFIRMIFFISMKFQAVINMNNCFEVAEADSISGNGHSLAIVAPDGIHFVKGTCREEIR